MDLCIKTLATGEGLSDYIESFNPCFNGSMYKNGFLRIYYCVETEVSILVLMDLCIKTGILEPFQGLKIMFQSLF